MLRNSNPIIFQSNTLVFLSNKLFKTSLMLFGSLLALTGFNTPAIAELDQADRAAIHRVIEQYIMDNPEMLRAALMKLAAQEKQAIAPLCLSMACFRL